MLKNGCGKGLDRREPDFSEMIAQRPMRVNDEVWVPNGLGFQRCDVSAAHFLGTTPDLPSASTSPVRFHDDIRVGEPSLIQPLA
jgi:hypothetical protein